MERVVVVGRKGDVLDDDDEGVKRGGEVADVDGVGNGKSGGNGKGAGKKGRKRESWLKVWKGLGFGRGG